MDWQDPSDELRVVLAVVRKPATNTTDYRGPIIVNPGVGRLLEGFADTIFFLLILSR
jgi:hypothetical protein